MAKTPALVRLLYFVALIPYRLVIIAYLSIFVFLKNVAWNAGLMLPLYFIASILLAISAATYPITANQEPIIQFLVDVTKAIEQAWNFIAAIIQQILECKEILVELWNDFMHLLAAILKRIFNTLNDELNLNLPPLFVWSLERELERHHYQETVRRVTEEVMTYANQTMLQIDPKYHHHYAEMFRMRILRIAARRAGLPQERITLIPSELCTLLQNIFQFIIGLLDIFSDWFLFFLDLLLGFFDFISGNFSQNFVFILVQTLIIEILQQLPFTECFIDTDSLDSSDIGDIFDAFKSQVARRLISCLCPWRYKNPLGFDPFLSPVSGGDDVPSNPGVAIFGCLCFNPTISLNSNLSIEDLFIKCLGIDVLIDQFKSFINTLENTFRPLYQWLVGAYYTLLNLFNSLKSAFESALRAIRRLEDLLPRSESPDELASVLEELEQHESDMRRMHAGFEQHREQEKHRMSLAQHFLEELDKQLTNRTYVEEMNNRPGMRQMQTVMSLAFHAHANGQNMIREFKADAPGALARTLDKLADDHTMKRFYKRLEEKHGPNRGEHVRAFSNGLNQILDIARSHFRNRYTRSQLDARIEQMDFRPFVRSVFALSGREDRLRATPGLRSLDAVGTLAIGSMFGRTELRRAAKELTKRYGQDEAARAGVRFAAPFLRNVDGFGDVMQRFNITTEDIERVERSVRQERRAMEKENKAQIDFIGNIRNYAAAEYVQYVDGVHHAYYEYSGAHMGGRVVVIAFALTAGAATSIITVAGFAIGAGLAAGATLLVGILAPLLVILVSFFQYTLSLFSHIAAGIIINALPFSTDAPYAYDVITPYIETSRDFIRRSFFFGFTIADMLDLAQDFGRITAKHGEYIAAWTVSYATGKWPLPLGRYIKARDPLIDEMGEMDEGFLDFIVDGILFCPHTQECLDDGDCGGADCVCQDNPSRLGTERPPAPCTGGFGQCRCWPFIQPRVGVNQYQTNLNLDPQCYAIYNFSPQDVQIYLDPLFQEKGWSLAFVVSRNFVNFSINFIRAGIPLLREIFRLIVIGGFVRWNAVFVPLAGTLFLMPSGLLRVIAIIALAVNTLTPTVRETALFFIDFFDTNKGLPLVGFIFEYLLTWLRFDNYTPSEPFGSPAANVWICVVANISPILYILTILLITLIVTSGLLLSGAVFLAWAFFVDILLLPLNILYFIVRSLIASSVMYQSGMIKSGRLRTSAEMHAPIYRYTTRPRDVHPERLASGSPMIQAGVLSTRGAVEAGGVAFVRSGKARAGKGMSWPRAVLLALMGLLMAGWRWGTMGWIDAWRFGPLRLRARPEQSRAGTCVVYTPDVPEHERDAFPMDKYIYTHTGHSIYEIDGIVPIDSRMVHVDFHDNSLAVYHARTQSKPEKTIKIN